MPDLFFSNEKEGHFHNIIMPNVYIRIFPYGSVLYSIRISLTLACPMNLKLYPLDRQVCSLRMASCKYSYRIGSAWQFRATELSCHLQFADGWTTADLVFLWKEGDPVQVVKNLHLPRFTLEKFLTDYCNSKTNTGAYRFYKIRFSVKHRIERILHLLNISGEYSCLKVDLLFKREFSYYLIQIYIPCCMLVIVSWVSFWLDQGAVPARVSLGKYPTLQVLSNPALYTFEFLAVTLLQESVERILDYYYSWHHIFFFFLFTHSGVTTLLTMATQTSGINASLPPVSYTKAIDVWTGVCLTFVFGALLEFALVNYASRSG